MRKNGRLSGLRLASLTVAAAHLLSCSLEVPADCDCSGTRSFEEFRAGIFEAGLYSGGPDEWYGSVGRKTLGTCIKLGLMPEDKVLDIGAGSLRIGWWLVQYVEPSNYHAIEPVQTRIDAAAELLGVNINVYYNDDFEFPDIPFDFVLARSIWTHSSKAMISKMLAEFAENSTPDAKFLTSVVFAETMEEDYMGDEWVGKVLKSDPGGTVQHSKGWIREECRKHGLTFKVAGTMHWQTWLLIERAGRASPKAPQAS